MGLRKSQASPSRTTWMRLGKTMGRGKGVRIGKGKGGSSSDGLRACEVVGCDSRKDIGLDLGR